MEDDPRLDQLRGLVERARELEYDRGELLAQLDRYDDELRALLRVTVPELMDEIGVESMGLPARGNYPACEVEVTAFFHANISMRWPQEQRQAALRWFDENGHADLIKTEVRFSFPREARREARDFVESCRHQGYEPDVVETIHNQTLTAWLRHQVTSGSVVPPLDMIGGTIARIARIKRGD